MDDTPQSDQTTLIEQLKAERDQLLGLLRALPDISFVIDEDGLYVRVIGGTNEAMYVSGKPLEGTTLQDALPESIADHFLEVVREALRTGEMQFLEYELGVEDVTALPPEIREKAANPSKQYFEGRILPLPSYDHPKPVVLWVAVNITPRKQLEQYWRQAAETDPLTGMANRRALFQQAHKEVERARRHGHPLSLLILDIDHFKSINSRFGQARGGRGPAALHTHLRRAPAHQRSSRPHRRGRVRDPVAGNRSAGSDPSGTPDRGSDPSMEIDETSPVFTITVSVGAATLEHGEGFEATLHRADQALSRAKANGRNRLETDGPHPTE